MSRPVAVIGGGWAGCAAAAVLAGHGVPVALYESGSTLGGRARRVERDDLPLDNGQHLLLGAYSATRTLLWAVHEHVVDAGLMRLPLSMRPLSPTQVEAITVSAWRLPPPFDLLLGLFTASGLSLSERSAAVAWYMRLRRQRFQCPTGQTVVELMSGLPPAVARLWSPLCTATLNTPPVRASAQVFARVLQLAFEGGRGASDFLAPVIDLSELMPEAAARAVESHGGHVHTRSTVRITGIQPGRIGLASGERRWHKPQVIIAVGPHQLASLFDDTLTTHSAVAPILACVKGWSYEPITTVYLGYGDTVAPPAHIARLDDQPGQWIFDRRDILMRAVDAAEALGLRALVAIVMSASGPHDSLAGPALIEACNAQLRRLRPDWPASIWSQVISERRATYACVPGLARPSWGRFAEGMYLAGDYTDPELPATLEAAVRSGEAAAHALLRDRGVD